MKRTPEPDAASLERFAARLARAAGERILAAAGRGGFAVHFKEPRPGLSAHSNPVSDVDRDVERFIRAELAAEYPAHAVIGEELGASGRGEVVWAVDPVDGTTNFVNGLPLFASSIGVLHRGIPLAGAIWSELARHWDLRGLGSATLELAFTAAGLLRLAYLARPSLWDAAAGVVLVRAAGCAARTLEAGRWTPLESFGGELERWCRPVLVGDEEALRAAVELVPSAI